MLEVDVVTAVIISLVATDVAGLFPGEVIVIICINCYCSYVVLCIEAAGCCAIYCIDASCQQ